MNQVPTNNTTLSDDGFKGVLALNGECDDIFVVRSRDVGNRLRLVIGNRPFYYSHTTLNGDSVFVKGSVNYNESWDN